ncbi:MAG: Zn-dependent oligopeptidase [Proteobacteria bacterium]|nr:Zn-dependent oligopeptidase [Pseudomonadota bacterium]
MSHRPAQARTWSHLLIISAALAAPAMAPAAPIPTPVHAWETGGTPAALEAWVRQHLQSADASIAKLLAVKGARTVDNTMRPYDDALCALYDAQSQAQLLYGVGESKELRDKAQALTQTVAAALAALNLNQSVYRALTAVPSPADPATRHYLERALLEYRLAGVDRDEATRAKIKALQDRITEQGLAFERTVHDDRRTVIVDKSQLEGLPADYIASHPADAEGHVRITTDFPDSRPAIKFGANADLRHKVFLALRGVAWPANTEILRNLLTARKELAQLLGYQTWADFAMADQMMGSPAKLAEFVEKVDGATREPAAREDAMLVAFARQREPALQKISEVDVGYWREQYRRAKFDFDSQSVRPYFPYAQVESGVITTASKLFHVQIVPVPGVHTWHPSVTTYDVMDGKTKLGRIYLDMHPRDGKDKWFSTTMITTGVRDRRLPDGALICNFPGGVAGDPGLMQYGDVVVFLHEFGHLMHHLIGSHNQFGAAGAFFVEGDFVEAPSQMLEEFFHDYGVIASFARHYQTGEALPKPLYERMIRADAYGRAADQQFQLLATGVSLDFHTLDPSAADFDAVYRRVFDRYSTAEFASGDHFWSSYTHLNGYSSNYYTYVLDKVIALDFFAQFDPKDLLGGPTGMRYRQTVLAPGATEPATQLVRDFLGRDTNLDAFRRWLGAEFQTPATASLSAR